MKVPVSRVGRGSCEIDATGAGAAFSGGLDGAVTVALGGRITLPAGGFVQAHAGADVPTDLDAANPEIFWRALLGWSLVPRRFGRMYSPMLEVLGARELGPGAAVVLWDLAPQVQVTLNRRKHLRLNVGGLVPLNRTDDRHPQLGMYLLWDWYEGSPLKGW